MNESLDEDVEDLLLDAANGALMNTENDFGVAKALLYALPLRTLYEMEQAASYDFRCSLRWWNAKQHGGLSNQSTLPVFHLARRPRISMLTMTATCEHCLQQIEVVVGSFYWLHVDTGRSVCGDNHELKATPVKGSIEENY